MFVNKKFKISFAILYSYKEILLLTAWSSLVVYLNYKFPSAGLSLPWLPIGVIGTAVAFFVGFKNNSAYQRRWEARKIWGAIVNDSRSFSVMVRDFSQSKNQELSDSDLLNLHIRPILKRHIAWLYQLTRQLRQPKSWEHWAKKDNFYRDYVKKDFPVEDQKKELLRYINQNELDSILEKANGATQLIALQSSHLKELRKANIINDFEYIELEKMISRFYDSQGKSERIKNYPIPRQYSSFSLYFVVIFNLLIPFGMVDMVKGLDSERLWGVIPLSVLIGWIFWATEVVGDYAEIPFEGLMDDIPMTNLSRTIEIDMLQMIDEPNIPPPVTPVNNYVM